MLSACQPILACPCPRCTFGGGSASHAHLQYHTAWLASFARLAKGCLLAPVCPVQRPSRKVQGRQADFRQPGDRLSCAACSVGGIQFAPTMCPAPCLVPCTPLHTLCFNRFSTVSSVRPPLHLQRPQRCDYTYRNAVKRSNEHDTKYIKAALGQGSGDGGQPDATWWKEIEGLKLR